LCHSEYGTARKPPTANTELREPIPALCKTYGYVRTCIGIGLL
jgi:hypothetical protein